MVRSMLITPFLAVSSALRPRGEKPLWYADWDPGRSLGDWEANREVTPIPACPTASALAATGPVGQELGQRDAIARVIPAGPHIS